MRYSKPVGVEVAGCVARQDKEQRRLEQRQRRRLEPRPRQSLETNRYGLGVGVGIVHAGRRRWGARRTGAKIRLPDLKK